MGDLDQETVEKVVEVKRIKNLAKCGQMEEAKKEIVAYLEKNPTDYYACFTAGRIFESDRCLDDAEYYLLKVVNSDSDNKYSAYGTLGQIAEDRNNIPKAIEYYQKALMGPYVETYSVRALSNIYLRRKESDKALKLIDIIKESSPDYYNYEKAKIYTELKEFTKAKEHLDKIPRTQLLGFNRKVYLQKAIVEKCLFNYDKALTELNKITSGENRDGLYFKALYEKAVVYNALKKYNKVIETLKPCDKNNEKVRFLLGRVNEIKGNISQAKEDYLISQNSYALNIKQESSYRLGDILLEEGKFNEAIEKYLRGVEKRTVFPTYIYLRIVAAYIRMEKYDDAYRYMKFIKENNPEIQNDKLYRSANAFLKDKLGYKIDRNTLCYRESILVDYSYVKMFNHVNYYQVETKPKFINYGFKEIYNIAKKNLTFENKVQTNLIDTYDIRVENIGVLNEKTTDKLRVIAVPNTELIADMYPSFDETLKDKMKREKEKQDYIKEKVYQKKKEFN